MTLLWVLKTFDREQQNKDKESQRIDGRQTEQKLDGLFRLRCVKRSDKFLTGLDSEPDSQKSKLEGRWSFGV
jgi:hypothetical protein